MTKTRLDAQRQGLLTKVELHNRLGQYRVTVNEFNGLLSVAPPPQSPTDGGSHESNDYLAQVYLSMLEATVGLLDWQRFEELRIEAEAAIAAITEGDELEYRTFDLRARLRILVTDYLRKTGRLDESESLARAALRRIQIPRTSEDDDRQLLVAELQLTRNLALVCEQQRKFDEAAKLFEQVVALRKRTLVDRMTPVEVMSHARFTRGFKMNQYLRPIAFGDYMDDQLRLSLLLQDLGRPHQAELMLAEAERTGLILSSMYGHVPRYFALLANTYSNLAMLHAESRPAESQIAIASAHRVWQTAVKAVPEIDKYQSGLRSDMHDLAWFRQQFPDHAITVADQSDSARAKGLRTDNHFTGIYLLNAGFSAEAIRRFEASLEQGPELQAYDWLYLALAHRELGNTEHARSYYQQASEWMEKNASNDGELMKLRESVAMSLGA